MAPGQQDEAKCRLCPRPFIHTPVTPIQSVDRSHSPHPPLAIPPPPTRLSSPTAPPPPPLPSRLPQRNGGQGYGAEGRLRARYVGLFPHGHPQRLGLGFAGSQVLRLLISCFSVQACDVIGRHLPWPQWILVIVLPGEFLSST